MYWKKYWASKHRFYPFLFVIMASFTLVAQETPLTPNTNPAPQGLTKAFSIPISPEVDAWFTDLQQTLYLVTKDEISKIGNPVNVKQSVKSWQSIDVIEPINPFKLLLFSSSQQQICIVDNTLTLNGDCFPMEEIGIANVTSISSSKRPDMFWTYDEVNSNIMLYNYLTKTIIQSVYNLKGLLGFKGNITLKENDFGLWVISDQNEILLLDDFLNTVHRFTLSYSHAVPYKNGVLYCNQNNLFVTDRFGDPKELHKISTEEKIKKIQITGNQLYIAFDNRIDVFIIP